MVSNEQSMTRWARLLLGAALEAAKKGHVQSLQGQSALLWNAAQRDMRR